MTERTTTQYDSSPAGEWDDWAPNAADSGMWAATPGADTNEWGDWAPAVSGTGTATETDSWADWSAEAPLLTEAAGADEWADWGDQAPVSPEDSFAALPNAEALGTPERQSRLKRIVAKMGGLATRFSGLFSRKERSFAGAIGADGSIDKGIKAASGYVGRADRVLDSFPAKAAKKIPVAGRFVRSAHELVGATGMVLDTADAINTGAGRVYGERDNLAEATLDQATGAAGTIAKEAGWAAAAEFGRRTGVEVSPDGVRVHPIKLGRAVMRVVTSRGHSLTELVHDTAAATADAAKARATGELVTARQRVEDVYHGRSI